MADRGTHSRMSTQSHQVSNYKSQVLRKGKNKKPSLNTFPRPHSLRHLGMSERSMHTRLRRRSGGGVKVFENKNLIPTLPTEIIPP